MSYMKLFFFVAVGALSVSRGIDAAEWVLYDGDLPENVVITTNQDGGKAQLGMPVCRYKRTVGWMDPEIGVCNTIGKNKRVKVRNEGFHVLICEVCGMVRKDEVQAFVDAATENMVSEDEVQAFVDAATENMVSEDEVQALIDEAVKEKSPIGDKVVCGHFRKHYPSQDLSRQMYVSTLVDSYGKLWQLHPYPPSSPNNYICGGWTLYNNHRLFTGCIEQFYDSFNCGDF